MKALAETTKRHKGPLAVLTAAGGGTMAVAGVGAAIAVGAALAGFYFLERARRKRGELGG